VRVNVRVKQKKWTKKELKYLKNNRDGKSDVGLSEALKRSLGSIRAALSKYGIKRSKGILAKKKPIKKKMSVKQAKVRKRQPTSGSWQPGESGNPNGRLKKGEALTDILRLHIDKHELAERLIRSVRKGNVIAIKYVFNRIDGMPRQTIKVDSEKDAEWCDLFKSIKEEAKEKVKKNNAKKKM